MQLMLNCIQFVWYSYKTYAMQEMMLKTTLHITVYLLIYITDNILSVLITVIIY